MRRLPRFWLTRIVVPLEVLVGTVLVSALEPSSLTAQAIETTGRQGWFLIALLGAACLVAMCDAFVNDILPHGFELPTALRFRHIGFMGMSGALSVLAFLIAYAHGYTPLLLFYWLNAILSAALAFTDMFARYRP
jgi:hypothetical protein